MPLEEQMIMEVMRKDNSVELQAAQTGVMNTASMYMYAFPCRQLAHNLHCIGLVSCGHQEQVAGDEVGFNSELFLFFLFLLWFWKVALVDLN